MDVTGGLQTMTLGYRSIILTMAISFTVTFAVLWRPRQAEKPLETVAAAPVVAPPGVRQPRREPVSAAPIAPPPRAMAAPNPSNLAPDNTRAAQAPELPVEIHFRSRPDLGRVQGSVINRSENELVIDATIFDPHTRENSKILLDIGPFASEPFGVNDGLEIQSGDTITLQSGSYRDRVSQIP
jgi:hypothetical protein